MIKFDGGFEIGLFKDASLVDFELNVYLNWKYPFMAFSFILVTL